MHNSPLTFPLLIELVYIVVRIRLGNLRFPKKNEDVELGIERESSIIMIKIKSDSTEIRQHASLA